MTVPSRAFAPLLLAAWAVSAAPEALAQLPPQLAPGRVAELQGEVLLLPAGWDEWRPAERNSAVAPGDWLRTSSEGGARLELAPSLLVSVDELSEFRTDRRDDVLVVELYEGRLVACSTHAAEGLSLVTPHGTAWLEPGGFYRVSVRPRSTEVAVSAGLAEVEREGHLRKVTPGRVGELSDRERKPQLSRTADRGWSGFDRRAHEACTELIDLDEDLNVVGAAALRGHGEWVWIGGLRYWRPFGVAAGWRPYGDGCFRWHPSWGWYFVPHATWGWVTHHHGDWAWFVDWGWVWYPDRWWHPHRAVFRVVNRNVYWCPRPAPRRHDGHHDRHDDRHHDRHHDRDHRDGPRPDRYGPPDAGWSGAPLDDFIARPIVRSRPPSRDVDLPTWRPLAEDPGLGDRPIERELVRPPLPARAREPLLAPGQGLAPTPELRRSLERPPTAAPGATDRLERPERPTAPARSVSRPTAIRPTVPSLRDSARSVTAPEPPAAPGTGRTLADRPAPSDRLERPSALERGAPEAPSRTPVPSRPSEDLRRVPAPFRPEAAPERPELARPTPAPSLRERPSLPEPRLSPSESVLRRREVETRIPSRPPIDRNPAPSPGIREVPRPSPPTPSPRVREAPTPTPPTPTPRVREAPPPTPPAPTPRVRETPRREVREAPKPAPPPRPQRSEPRKRGDDDDRRR